MSRPAKGPSMEKELSSIGIFSGLDREGLKVLSGLMERRAYASGALIFSEGDPGDELHALAAGSVKISVKTAEGEEIELSRVAAGGFFGDMAIIERAPRSASCRALEDCVCLVLKSADFDRLLEEKPGTAKTILEKMLSDSAARLVKTGAFLSQMVQWGDDARKRAITDAATGLLNRRYLDDSIDALVTRADRDGTPLSFAMFDLDRFGKLNAQYGADFCDKIIIAVAGSMKETFSEGDILVRYGGDEFCFLFPAQGVAAARQKCDALCAAVRSLSFPEQPELRLSCSIGVADLFQGQRDSATLKANADKALYEAKEAGRDRALAFSAASAPAKPSGEEKIEIPTIAEKNRIVRNIVRALEERDSFLIIGHQNPDEDCVSSMVAFGLIASKMNKKAVIATGTAVQDNFRYLLNICRYNSIEVHEGDEVPLGGVSALVLLDTAKPSMIDRAESYKKLIDDPAVVKIEIDHHLQADARYFGDPGYRLVTGASSSCEIVGLLAFKMDRDPELLKRHQIEELFSRNLVLAILSGIIGDSRMGRYLKTRRERWFYAWFSSLFERMLAQKTRKDSANFSSKEQVFDALESLSSDEAECFNFLTSRKRSVGRLGMVVLDQKDSKTLFSAYGGDTAVAVSKAVVDNLAEGSGCLGFLAFYDDPDKSPFVQFRLRRSQSFSGLDLRDVIARLGIENGGGHPGAVGFRIPRDQVVDVIALTDGFARRIDEMAAEVSRA